MTRNQSKAKQIKMRVKQGAWTRKRARDVGGAEGVWPVGALRNADTNY